MPRIACIIIEDETPAQVVLKSFIAKAEWLNLSGVFCDALDALGFLKRNDVDLVFLDIQIPGLTGLDFLKALKNPPQIIITTAYSQYAIEAFELDVRDYLIKPFSFDRFLKSINRIAARPEPVEIHQFQNVTAERSFAFFNVNKTIHLIK